jgi:predicted nucleic acid-binding protein
VGLILDSSVLIAAERRGHSLRQILEQIRTAHGEVEVGLSVVTIAELMHGAYRARSDADRQRRLSFIDQLCSDIPVHPVTLEIARSVGRIEGQQAAIGIAISFEDLAIGVTALHVGFDLATLNVTFPKDPWPESDPFRLSQTPVTVHRTNRPPTNSPQTPHPRHNDSSTSSQDTHAPSHPHH